MTDHEARAREICRDLALHINYDPNAMMQEDGTLSIRTRVTVAEKGIFAISQAIREAEEANHARISSLEQRVKELEEALEFYADPQTYHAIAFAADPPCGEFAEDFSDDHGDDYDRAMPGKRAREVLCHATDPRAESPHRADGAPQSEDGDTR